MDEVFGVFPAISPERIAFQQALKDALPTLQKLKTLAPDVIMYLDGSYTTSKRSPNDVDFLFLTNRLDEDQIIAFFDQECPIAATNFHIHADPIGKTKLIDLFTVTRSLQTKGIIILDV